MGHCGTQNPFLKRGGMADALIVRVMYGGSSRPGQVVLMALALTVSRSRSARGCTEAVPADERTRPVAPSGHHACPAIPSPASSLTGRIPPATQQTKDSRGASLELAEAWPRRLDDYLKDFLGANRGQEGDAITSTCAAFGECRSSNWTNSSGICRLSHEKTLHDSHACLILSGPTSRSLNTSRRAERSGATG